MAGDNTLTTLLTIGAIVGTGGALAAPLLGGTAAAGAAGAGAAAAGTAAAGTAAAGTAAAGTAAAGTAATAAATGSTLFGVSSGTLLTAGQASLIGLGVTSSMQAAEATKLDYESRQQQEKTAFALQEEQRERELRSILSSQTAVFGSSGVSLGSGAPITAAQQSIGASNLQSRVGGLGSRFRQAGLSSSAASEAQRSKAAIAGGLLRGASLLE